MDTMVRDRGVRSAYPWPVTVTSREWPLPGDPDASVGARHHRVPRLYLERLANERMQITTAGRRTRAGLTAAVRETAAEKGFTTAVNTGGAKAGKSGHLLSRGQVCRVAWWRWTSSCPGECGAHRCGR